MEFKVYLNKNTEHFIYKEDGGEIKAEFDFTQTLLDLLDLDIFKYEYLFDDMKKALYELYSKENVERNISVIKSRLDTLAELHIYFKLVKIDWFERLDKFYHNDCKSATDTLPIKQLTRITSYIVERQRQITDILSTVLDIFSSDGDVQKKMIRYCERGFDIKFKFENLSTTFEIIGSSTFAEVLYSKNIYEIIEFFVRELLKREQPFKVCKSCGRYFAIISHTNSEYCNRLFKDTNKTCKEIGAVKVYQAKVADNLAMKEFNKSYKTHFARIKYKRMTKEEFKIWSDVARKYRDEVMDGKKPLDGFIKWLKR